MDQDEIRPQDMQISRRLTREERLAALSRGMSGASSAMRRAILGEDYDEDYDEDET